MADRTAPRELTDDNAPLRYAIACGVQADGTVTTLKTDADGNLQTELVDGFRVLASSGVAVPLTGSTSETVLATVSIPAGAMGPNGILKISAIYSCNNDASAKTPRIRLGGIGGTILADPPMASVLSARLDREVANRNSQASQISSAASNNNSFTVSANAVITATINTANATDLVFTGQLVDGTDTLTLEYYKVELCYRA